MEKGHDLERKEKLSDREQKRRGKELSFMAKTWEVIQDRFVQQASVGQNWRRQFVRFRSSATTVNALATSKDDQIIGFACSESEFECRNGMRRRNGHKSVPTVSGSNAAYLNFLKRQTPVFFIKFNTWAYFWTPGSGADSQVSNFDRKTIFTTHLRKVNFMRAFRRKGNKTFDDDFKNWQNISRKKKKTQNAKPTKTSESHEIIWCPLVYASIADERRKGNGKKWRKRKGGR